MTNFELFFLKTQNDMMSLTTAADTFEGTYATLTSLKETIEIAEKLLLPEEIIKDSYNSMEKMATRVNTVSCFRILASSLFEKESFNDLLNFNYSLAFGSSLQKGKFIFV